MNLKKSVSLLLSVILILTLMTAVYAACPTHEFADELSCQKACLTCSLNTGTGCWGCDATKELPEKELMTMLIKENLEKIDLSTAPKSLKFILGKPKVNIIIKENGDFAVYGFEVTGERITGFAEGGIEKPNYEITVSKDALTKLINSKDPATTLEELYLDGKVTVEAKTFGSKIKLWIAKMFMKKRS
ncbi:hypothetical protein KY330_05145 [Candidatus Woesearchaeota archaeon]|nr:hypothetical protein [Candidatus Woesearchaeota archaeon]